MHTVFLVIWFALGALDQTDIDGRDEIEDPIDDSLG